MNNLSKANLGARAKDLASIIVPSGFTEWFANYLVVKRAAQVGQALAGGNDIALGWGGRAATTPRSHV